MKFMHSRRVAVSLFFDVVVEFFSLGFSFLRTYFLFFSVTLKNPLLVSNSGSGSPFFLHAFIICRVPMPYSSM